MRVKKGIFINADAQGKARDQVREMAPTMAVLDGAQSQMKSLSTDVQTVDVDPADLSPQITLLQRNVKDPTRATTLLSTSKSVVIVSGEHLQLAVSRSLVVNVGNYASIGVVKNMLINVGQVLSVFMRKVGIRLFINKGATSIQAQNDLMELLVQKSIVITSAEDEIKITTKKKITLNGGGSYIRLGICGIEAGTPREHNAKTGYYGREPKAKLTPELMVFPIISMKFDKQVRVTDDDRKFIANIPYYMEDSVGNIYKGFTDSAGYRGRIFTEEADDLNVPLGIKALERW